MLRRRFFWLVLALIVVSVLFLTLGAKGSWSFTLWFRGQKLASLVLIGGAISTATILFQTITHNRILTPSIMGFDALYVLILTVMIFMMGASGYAQFLKVELFLINLVLLTLASVALFTVLLKDQSSDLMRMVLTGIILGSLFRSLVQMIQRLIDPSEFSVLQSVSFARFNKVDADLLLVSAVLVGLTWAVIWKMRHRLDILALGVVLPVSLGADPNRGQLLVLVLISILVSVSTALVGPVAFLGLLVSSLTYRLIPSWHHGHILPAAILIGGITLVGGQMVLERILHLETPLAVVVECLGGLVFLFLILRKGSA
ncbi:iron chelate uptake ABC transporter family permease subunit [Pseudophaeobacter leonis]|uniref:iron chelate uptake ABC transporter family permease subunit n=1 Tax=Pseudophaeobacter leonis TaxID=1144477 RepID=UPI0009F3F979|nr:iron chelate uptake ABC transporter family permease subunit [Pseudophaeobacter leonis]